MKEDSIKIEGITQEEKSTWDYINSAKTKQIQFANSMWRDGYEKMKSVLQTPTVFEDIAIPHWRVVPIDGKAEDHTFFDRLSKGVFNTNIYLRKWDERDYLPTRCRWHDSFGHLPHLFDDDYSFVLRWMGMLGRYIWDRHGDSKIGQDYMTMLSRLYWYTIEFGLIMEQGTMRSLGAGIISSPGETEHVHFQADSMNKIHIFDLDTVIRTDFIVDDFQHTYFVLGSMDELKKAVKNFSKMII